MQYSELPAIALYTQLFQSGS